MALKKSTWCLITAIDLNALDYRPMNATDLCVSAVFTVLLSDRSNPAFILQPSSQANFRFIIAGSTESNLEISVSWKNRMREMDTSFWEVRHTQTMTQDRFAHPKIGTSHSSFKLPRNRNWLFFSMVSLKVIKLKERAAPVGLWKNGISAWKPPRRPLIKACAKPWRWETWAS